MKKSIKKANASIIVFLVFSIFLSGCKIQSSKNYYNNKSDLTNKDTVSITIRCDKILDNMDKLNKNIIDIVPKDGLILETTNVEVKENETAFDILIKVAKQKNIVINKNGTNDTAYIIGINGIKEFDCGELSGWIYKINSEQVGVSCGAAKVKKGDIIEFLYTCDLGNDLE